MPSLTEGRITVIHQTTREWAELNVAGKATDIDSTKFPACDKPLTAQAFRGHGMNFGPVHNGKALL